MQKDTRNKEKKFVVLMAFAGLIGVGSLIFQIQQYRTSLSEDFSSPTLTDLVNIAGGYGVAQSHPGDLYYNHYQALGVARMNRAMAQWWH